jgi:predicted nucleotidyltransferase component of viral defense system
VERNIENIAASVHQRLLDKAKESSRPFNELLQHFAIERFIYRLSKSRHADTFILKGALMFSTWSGTPSRPTMDIDLLVTIDNSLKTVVTAMKNVCRKRVAADGMSFNAETVTAARITEGAEHEGVRVRVRGGLGNARVSLQIDIGFGDVIVPGPSKIVYPALLDFPAPELNGYTMESMIAEKFQAMVKLGVLNNRMKDFYDIWMLSRSFDFKGEVLAEAVEKTFENRNTLITNVPTIFDPSFVEDADKKAQWQGFIRKAKLADAPGAFGDVVAKIEIFLHPLVDVLAGQRAFRKMWTAPGPWR